MNKDFEPSWNMIGEFVPLPDGLPYGDPLEEALKADSEAIGCSQDELRRWLAYAPKE